MPKQLGLGVMIGRMFSRPSEELADLIGKKIISITIEDNVLIFEFSDGLFKIWDDGQSCCEHRYMSTDDNLKYHEGAKLLGIGIKDAGDIEDDDGECHECQFLEVSTSKGRFQCVNHNEHNGYYGGFSLTAKFEPFCTDDEEDE